MVPPVRYEPAGKSTYTVLMAAGPPSPYILEALASIYAQTLPPARVCVLVNGQHDSPTRFIRNVSARYPEVEVLVSPGTGMVPALNMGMELTTTEFVAFLDTDDIWSPDKQQLQIEALRADPTLNAVYSLATNFRTRPSGERVPLGTAPAKTFTNTTFPLATFQEFGALDPHSSHFSWLYRWWAHAHDLEIRTAHLDSVGLWRRIHGENSWITDNARATSTVLAEIRRLVHDRRKSE